MPTVTVTRRLHFNAAHRLHNASWSDEKNRSMFGLCNNPNYHGHNYELEVSVRGEVDPETGYVADLSVVKSIAQREVVAYLDHKNLNLDIPEFASQNPTAENIAIVIWNRLDGKLPGHLTRVVVWETPRNSATYEGG